MSLLEDPRAFFGVAAIQDPYPLYRRMRTEAPVHRIGRASCRERVFITV